jgi:hypothetical protein
MFPLRQFRTRVVRGVFQQPVSSRIKAQYTVRCDQSWFFGTELLKAVGAAYTLDVTGSEAHVYGGVIRAKIGGTAVHASGAGKVHIHGTGIDVATGGTALLAENGGEIHANGVGYSYPAGGSMTRIANLGGHVHAPYLWEEHASPPNITSVTGADMAVVTDGTQPHLVIYSGNCASKWFDTSTNACRP